MHVPINVRLCIYIDGEQCARYVTKVPGNKVFQFGKRNRVCDVMN